MLVLAVCSVAGVVLAISGFQRAEESRVSVQLVAGQQMFASVFGAQRALQAYDATPT